MFFRVLPNLRNVFFKKPMFSEFRFTFSPLPHSTFRGTVSLIVSERPSVRTMTTLLSVTSLLIMLFSEYRRASPVYVASASQRKSFTALKWKRYFFFISLDTIPDIHMKCKLIWRESKFLQATEVYLEVVLPYCVQTMAFNKDLLF